jgi:hypothetical protein
MTQYKSLLEGAWIDGVISNEERVFLGKKRKELGLSIEDSEIIQRQILGASISDVIEKELVESNPSYNILDNCGDTVYWGGCTNLTVDPPTAAELVLTFTKFTEEKISGKLFISEPLGGGSIFTGKIAKDRVEFVTRSDGYEITWRGTLQGDMIVNGEYSVIAKDLKLKTVNAQKQNGVWNCHRISNPSYNEFAADIPHIGSDLSRTSPFHLSLAKSSIGLKVVALEPKQEFQGEELISATHFVITYLLRLKLPRKGLIESFRIFFRSSDGRIFSIFVPDTLQFEENELLLSSFDLSGWVINSGDVITIDANSCPPCEFQICDEACQKVDHKKSLDEDIPCIIVLRSASFGSSFVLKITNIHPRKLKITSLRSSSGNLKAPLEIEPNATAEIGWLELDRNFKLGDTFQISFQGFRDVEGVVAEDKTGGGGVIWAALGAAGGLALAALGG